MSESATLLVELEENDEFSLSLRDTLLSSGKNISTKSSNKIYITEAPQKNVSTYTFGTDGNTVLVKHVSSLKVNQAMKFAMKKRAKRHLKVNLEKQTS